MNAPASEQEVRPRERDTLPLAPGRRLGDFLITRVVGQGGFGIVYEAEDLTLQRRVAIKEYLPSQLATRVDESRVEPISGRYTKTFDLGRRSFLAEARLLAQFRHPGLLEVLHFWEQNGTAYMVMPFYEGRTLEQMLANGPATVDEAWLKAMIRPVLDALEHMHASDCYHRDVSADNILIRDGGKAMLLDLGAARRVIGDSERALTVMLKPGYAPIEQYADDPACRQGPWTDIYAVAAVLYFAVTRCMPPASASRVMHDSLPALAERRPPGYGRRFLEAIDRGLSIRPEQRPRTIGEFRSMLFATTPEDGIGATDSDADEAAADAGRHAPARSGRTTRSAILAVCAAVAVAGIAAAWSGLDGDAPADAPAIPAQAVAPASGVGTLAGVASDALPAPEAAQAGTAGASADAAASRSDASAPVGYTGVLVQAAAEQGRTPAGASSRAGEGDAAASKPAAANKTGVVRLAIQPWGEIFVDGVSRGVSPPVKQLTLAAGVHRIEIRNPARESATREITVREGKAVVVSHRFK